MWSQHLIAVIPSEVEAATQPRKLSGRGQTFNPVAQLKGNNAWMSRLRST